jgi:hypothetical protein
MEYWNFGILANQNRDAGNKHRNDGIMEYWNIG